MRDYIDLENERELYLGVRMIAEGLALWGMRRGIKYHAGVSGLLDWALAEDAALVAQMAEQETALELTLDAPPAEDAWLYDAWGE